MSKTLASGAGADQTAADAAAAAAANAATIENSAASGSQLAEIKAAVDGDVHVYPDMPEIGEKCLLRAVFGRMVNPLAPEPVNELAPEKITRAVFDTWHRTQWLAGKIALAD